jgi:hypothetical protein
MQAVLSWGWGDKMGEQDASLPAPCCQCGRSSEEDCTGAQHCPAVVTGTGASQSSGMCFPEIQIVGCGRSMLQTTGGKLRKRRDSDGCCVGPGESDSILYILASAAFFFFF